MFYPVEIDACPAFGWQRGPFVDVLIKPLVSGREKRKPQSDLRKHTFILPFMNIFSQDYLDYINNAFMALHVPTDSFLVKDYLDHRADNQTLGVAPSGSTPVQLVRTYTFADDFAVGPTYTRIITKPKAAGFYVRQSGLLKPVTVDTLTGLITPVTPWTPGAEIDWTGEFRVPVRFDQMSLPSTIDNRSGERLISNGSVSLIEVYGE
jgi:uncharacterized protein (TIGR02217 family)